MAEIEKGSDKWWAWAAEGGLDVKTTATEPKSDRDSRREARKAGLRDEDTEEVGWNMTKGLGGKGHNCFWHTSDLTHFTTRKMDLLAKLGRAAPKQKRAKRQFTSGKREKRDKKHKLRGKLRL